MNNKIAYKDMSYRERREYHNQKQREYKARYPEKTKQRHQNSKYKKYGLTEYTFNELLKKQKNKCKICGETFGSINNDGEFKNRIYIDHCHKTKQVRGLLCPYCNTLLGYAKDSDMDLMKAIKYIKENQYPEKDRDIVRQLANEMEEKFINTFYIKKDEDLKP